MAIDVNKLRTQWDSLSYAEQQQKLNSNSELRNAANQLWFTIKTNPEAQAVNKTQVSKVTSNKSNNNALVWTGAVASMPEQPTVYSGIDTHDYSKDQSIDTRRQNWVLQSTPASNPSYSSVDTRRSNTSTYTPDPNYASVDTRRYQSTLYRSEDPNRVNTTAPKTTTTSQPKSTVVTPKQQEWDYQDNSQARMNQIADNLDRYKITNPELFKDYDSFYNFFIDGKGRSADQIRFLDNWYANYKKTEKYNNMSAEEVGKWIANWVIPEDYISTTWATDPDRADAIKWALEDAQDSIANESYLSELAGLSGFHAWNAKEMLYKDENNDWLDDRLYHEPTEEERKLVEENNEYEAERLKLNNAMKDLQSDLTEQYPDADLSTIMLLTSDRGNKIQKSLDTLAVSQTKVQWTLKYLQTERATMDKAGQNTIKELQDNYWIYMEYSPEWIMQMTQAKYAAENITLDQADSGNETQKQMALDKVLTGYYDKYWAIIQRSKDQVINDVIAYAKKNWTTLSEALEKNFLQYLRAKPEFEALSIWWAVNWSWTLEPIKDADWNIVSYVKIDKNTGKVEWVTWTIGWLVGGLWASWTWLGWSNWTDNWAYTDYTPISESALNQWLRNFLAKYTDENWKVKSVKAWQCWTFVNDYLQSLGYDRLYKDPIDKKKAITNTDTPAVWAVAVMDSKNYPKYWHVAIVTKVNPDWTVNLAESNWGWDETVHHRINVSADKIYWYFNPSIQPHSENPWWSPMYEQVNSILNNKNNWLTKDERASLQLAENMYYDLYQITADWSLDHFLNSWDFQNIMAKMNKKSFTNADQWEWFLDAWQKAVSKSKITDQVNQRVITAFTNLIEKKLRKESWAAISSSEWLSNFENYIPWAWEDLKTKQDKLLNWEKNIIYPTFRYSWITEWYKWLFGWDNPYYKSSNWWTVNNNANTSKWTWNITAQVNNQTSWWTDYSSLFSMLKI